MVVGSRMKGELRTSTTNRIGNFFLNFISFIITKHLKKQKLEECEVLYNSKRLR